MGKYNRPKINLGVDSNGVFEYILYQDDVGDVLSVARRRKGAHWANDSVGWRFECSLSHFRRWHEHYDMPKPRINYHDHDKDEFTADEEIL